MEVDSNADNRYTLTIADESKIRQRSYALWEDIGHTNVLAKRRGGDADDRATVGVYRFPSCDSTLPRLALYDDAIVFRLQATGSKEHKLPRDPERVRVRFGIIVQGLDDYSEADQITTALKNAVWKVGTSHSEAHGCTLPFRWKPDGPGSSSWYFAGPNFDRIGVWRVVPPVMKSRVLHEKRAYVFAQFDIRTPGDTTGRDWRVCARVKSKTFELLRPSKGVDLGSFSSELAAMEDTHSEDDDEEDDEVTAAFA